MKNIIFDIDGTLWDSTDVVAESWNEAIWEKARIKANLDGDKLKKLFGKTMDEIGRLMLPTLDDEKRAEVCQACYDYEDAYLEKHSGVFYDGVIDTLNELAKDYNLYVVSNCQVGSFLMRTGFWQAFFCRSRSIPGRRCTCAFWKNTRSGTGK